MGGWETVMMKDAELKQANRIVGLLVAEIERNYQRIEQLQDERRGLQSRLMQFEGKELTVSEIMRNAPR